MKELVYYLSYESYPTVTSKSAFDGRMIGEKVQKAVRQTVMRSWQKIYVAGRR